MSYGLHVFRFNGGEPVPLDETVTREVLGPVTVGGMAGRRSAGILGVAELAHRTGAMVMPLDRPVILTRETDRGHLPESLRAEAIVVPPAARPDGRSSR